MENQNIQIWNARDLFREVGRAHRRTSAQITLSFLLRTLGHLKFAFVASSQYPVGVTYRVQQR